MPACQIFDLRKFSINDGPGIRTSVFFKGCPLRCWWCHNPESQDSKTELFFFEDRCNGCSLCLDACKKQAISIEDEKSTTNRDLCDACGDCVAVCPSRAREVAGHAESTSSIIEEIEKDIPFYLESEGGVTFTGGEPLAQPEALLILLKACRERGIHTAVDTSGYAPSDTIRMTAKWTDLFLYDLKLADSLEHKKHTSVSNKLIIENLRALAKLDTQIRVRIPIVPGVNDSIDNMQKTADIIGDLDRPIEVDLLPLHRSAAAKYERLGKEKHPRWSTGQTDHINKLTKTFENIGLRATLKE